MKRILTAAIVLGFGFGFGAAALALQKATTPKVPAGGTMATESTTKYTGKGPKTKTKTQMVVGTVKEYVSGKKIVVTGPKNKDYSFDLDQNAGVTGDVAVGKKVKVTYTKTDTGEKVTTIAPYTGSKRKSTKKTT